LKEAYGSIVSDAWVCRLAWPEGRKEDWGRYCFRSIRRADKIGPGSGFKSVVQAGGVTGSWWEVAQDRGMGGGWGEIISKAWQIWPAFMSTVVANHPPSEQDKIC